MSILPDEESAELVDELREEIAELRTALATKDLALAAAGVRELKLREALSLAQRWLSNCVPVVKIDGPTPLPVIAAALSATTDTAALEALCLRAARIAQADCDRCEGTGLVHRADLKPLAENCAACNGSGRMTAENAVKQLLSDETGAAK